MVGQVQSGMGWRKCRGGQQDHSSPRTPLPSCPHLQPGEVALLVAAVVDAQPQEQLHGLFERVREAT